VLTLGAAAALAGFLPYLLSPKKGVGQVRGAPVKAAGTARPTGLLIIYGWAKGP